MRWYRIAADVLVIVVHGCAQQLGSPKLICGMNLAETVLRGKVFV